MRGGSLRVDVQSVGPESVFTGWLGKEHDILQGPEGEFGLEFK